ncbi:MAG: sugar phosphate isomerase/epimerase [Clostridia bacterium]|nr:sugar phosphate isomerase/epimerase [Clostridia bacterium]
MINGLAIWHYPHRTMVDNIRYFAALGLPSVSVHGTQFVNAIADPGTAQGIADAVSETGVVFTVHYCLPRSHEADAVEVFETGIRAIAAWQKAHGTIAVLSFDVPQPIRAGMGIGGYLDFVLDTVPDCRVAVEDFGLTASERGQIKHLKGNHRFGYLVDLGHMFLRLRGQNTSGKTLFTNSLDEHPPVASPDYAAFMASLDTKEFPIFEMHLHNNDGEDDVHWFLEQGTLDVPAVARVLKDRGYDGVLTIESAPGFRFECRGKDADEGIARTLAYWKECCEA